LKKLKRIDFLKENIQNNLELLRCPICKNVFTEIKDYSVYCGKGHNFNINKKGYVHLLTGNHKSLYDAFLFNSRNAVYEARVYDAFIEKLAELINNYHQTGNLLDAGTGEGYFLNELARKLNGFSYLGLDIAKDGLIVAAKSEQPIIWTVGDLANLPLEEKSLHLILNILSPANYEEFQRVLKNDGILIKVVPGQNYLKEIRESIQKQFQKEEHSNASVISTFEKNFNLIHKEAIAYELPVHKELWINLIRMTPMTSSLTSEERQLLEDSPAEKITIDLIYLIGTAKS